MKRLFDFVAACLGLVVASPMLGVIALLIKATSNGPVFFRQERVGLWENVFRVYKFRTMIDRAEEIGTSVTTQDDPRITPLGRVLRKTKLDELPQLINVFKGEMSLVGPRPDVPEIVKSYTPKMRRIFQIRPGVTSVAMLYLKNEEQVLAKFNDPDTFYEEVLVPMKVKFAMGHVDRDSFVFDLKILCRTIWMLTLSRWWPIEEHDDLSFSSSYGLNHLPRRKRAGYEKEKQLLYPPLPNPLPKKRKLTETAPQADGVLKA